MDAEQLHLFFTNVQAGLITIQRVRSECLLGDLSDWMGNVEFVASNGWKITVFFDVGEWDYIDHIEVDGVMYGYDDNVELFNEKAPLAGTFGEPGYLGAR